jgi:hypothetical protein
LEIGEVTSCTQSPPRPGDAAFNGILGFDDDKYKAAYRKWAIRIDACKQNERKKAAQALKDAEAAKIEAERNLAAKKMDALQKEMQRLKDDAAKKLLATVNDAEKKRLQDQIKALEQREQIAKELAAKAAVPANTDARNEIEKMSGKNLYDLLAQAAEQRGAPPAWSWGMGAQYAPGMMPPQGMVPPGYVVAPWGGIVPEQPISPTYAPPMQMPFDPQMQSMQQMQSGYQAFPQQGGMMYQDDQSLASYFGISGVENDAANLEMTFAGTDEWLATEGIPPLRMPTGNCPSGCAV